MGRRGKTTAIKALLAIVIAIEMIFVAVRISAGRHTDYEYSYSYSIAMDAASTAPGPGNITLLLDVTNKGAIDGLPILHMHVLTDAGHSEEFVSHLGLLAKNGGHLNTTWYESFIALDPKYARILAYVLDS